MFDFLFDCHVLPFLTGLPWVHRPGSMVWHNTHLTFLLAAPLRAMGDLVQKKWQADRSGDSAFLQGKSQQAKSLVPRLKAKNLVDPQACGNRHKSGTSCARPHINDWPAHRPPSLLLVHLRSKPHPPPNPHLPAQALLPQKTSSFGECYNNT